MANTNTATEKRYGTWATRSSRRPQGPPPAVGHQFRGSNGQKWEIIEIGKTWKYYSQERLEDTGVGDAWGWCADYVCVEAAS